jgi:hypothetical protein
LKLVALLNWYLELVALGAGGSSKLVALGAGGTSELVALPSWWHFELVAPSFLHSEFVLLVITIEH